MTRYAKGRHAVAECQRSGQKMRYRDLVEDGHIPGLLVHPDWWEPKHPQETPPDVTDPIALRRPAPEISVGTGYGDPEAPAPLPTDPALGSPSSPLTQTMSEGEMWVAIDEPMSYEIGQYVFIALDGGGYFVSTIRSTADTPSYSIPFTTPFTGTATTGNLVYIASEGFNPLPLVQQNFSVTLGNYISDSVFYVGYHLDGLHDAVHQTNGINDHVSSITPLDGNGIASVVGDNGIPIGVAGIWQSSSQAFIVEFYVPPAYAGARILLETYSTIEIDHSGGTMVLSTADYPTGDMNHSLSRDSDYGGFNPDNLIYYHFSWSGTGKSVIWPFGQVGNTYTVRFIP